MHCKLQRLLKFVYILQMLVNYLAAVGKGKEMPTELSEPLLTLLQTQLNAPNYEGGSIQVDVVDKGSDLKLLMLDLTQEKVAEHKFLSLSCCKLKRRAPTSFSCSHLGPIRLLSEWTRSLNTAPKEGMRSQNSTWSKKPCALYYS